MITLKLKKLHDQATIPTKKFYSDAGWDLYSAEELSIPAGEQRMISTGIWLAGIESVHLEDKPELWNIVLQVWSRSGMDAKKGLHVGAGIVDQDYRGEILVLLKNTSNKDQLISVGDKIAQMVTLYLPQTNVVETEEIDETDRGEQGGITEYHKGVKGEA